MTILTTFPLWLTTLPLWLATLPLWLAGILVVGVPVFAAMVGPLVVRLLVSVEKLRVNNEVAGFKFATIGVLYAVLLGFAVIVVWEKISDAEKAVAQEAGAATTIYHLTDGIRGQSGPALRQGMTAYLKTVIVEDWPAMESGTGSNVAMRALAHVYAIMLKYKPRDRRDTALLTEILHELDLVTQARRTRLVLASGAVPGVIWLVLFGGGFLTVSFTFFFGAEHLRAQSLMAGALALLIFSELLVIVMIDYPFAGTVKVEPEALSSVLGDYGG
jgi:Protein of unknown function (DUF4239)